MHEPFTSNTDFGMLMLCMCDNDQNVADGPTTCHDKIQCVEYTTMAVLYK